MDVVLYGAANPHAQKMIRDIEAARPDVRFVGFIDDNLEKVGTTFVGRPVLGTSALIDEFIALGYRFANLLCRDMSIRCATSRAIVQRGGSFFELIHPSVDVSLARLGQANWIQENVDIQAAVTIGDNCSVHVRAIISHEATLGDSVFIAPNATLCGFVKIEDGAFVGANATLIPHVRVGRWATVAAGSVVMKDVPDGATVIGNPAKILHMSPLPCEDGAIFNRVADIALEVPKRVAK